MWELTERDEESEIEAIFVFLEQSLIAEGTWNGELIGGKFFALENIFFFFFYRLPAIYFTK